jgi:hypothetical protein
MFCAPVLISAVPRASGPVFKFYAPRLIFDGTEGFGSCFLVLRARNRFRRYRGRRVPFSCFARPDLLSVVPRASAPVFMFCMPGLGFGCTEGVSSRFHILRARTRFLRYRGRRVPFSCFERPDSFSAIPRASTSVFMFCAPGLVFSGTEGFRSRFLILRARNRFRRYRGSRVPFSCFARHDSFSAVPRASAPVFLFCAPGPISAVPRALVPIFMFCAPGLVLGGTEGIGTRFHVLRARTRFRRYRGRRLLFS